MKVDTQNMVQLTQNKDKNWDIYLDEKENYCYSVAIVNGCHDSCYGNFKHFIAMIWKYNAEKKEDLTEKGLQLVKEYTKSYYNNIDEFFAKCGHKLAK